MTRTCACGTILRRGNHDGICGPCDLRERMAAIHPMELGDRDPREDLRDQLIEWVNRHGRTPSKSDCEGLPSESVYRAHFGSWTAALAYASMKPVRAGERKNRANDRAGQVKEAIRDGYVKTGEIARYLRCTDQAAYNALFRLRQKGVVTGRNVSGAKVWSLVKEPAA